MKPFVQLIYAKKKLAKAMKKIGFHTIHSNPGGKKDV
jgi:hypothetical protein